MAGIQKSTPHLHGHHAIVVPICLPQRRLHSVRELQQNNREDKRDEWG